MLISVILFIVCGGLASALGAIKSSKAPKSDKEGA